MPMKAAAGSRALVNNLLSIVRSAAPQKALPQSSPLASPDEKPLGKPGFSASAS